MVRTYHHILWDWNGTLFDDTWLCVSVMNTLLVRRNLPLLTVDTYRTVFTFPVRTYYQAIGLDLAADSFEDLSIEFMEQYEARRQECSLCLYAREVLSYVKQAGVGQSILSAYPYDGLVNVVQHFELEHFFERLLGLEDIYARSKLDLARNWMQARGYAPSEVLLIGDTTHDFEVANAIGADCLLVTNGHNAKERLEQCHVRVLNSLLELVEED
jgi:phosphoglycolate phosphatase